MYPASGSRCTAVELTVVAGKEIDPMVQQVIGLDDIPEGLAQLETRHVRGKIVAELV